MGVVRSMVHLRNQEVSVMAGAWGEKVKGQAMRWGGRWGTGSHRVLQVFTKWGGAPAHRLSTSLTDPANPYSDGL